MLFEWNIKGFHFKKKKGIIPYKFNSKSSMYLFKGFMYLKKKIFSQKAHLIKRLCLGKTGFICSHWEKIKPPKSGIIEH